MPVLIGILRRKSKASIKECLGFKHRDLIKYIKKDGINRCQLMWRFNKIYWW